MLLSARDGDVPPRAHVAGPLSKSLHGGFCARMGPAGASGCSPGTSSRSDAASMSHACRR